MPDTAGWVLPEPRNAGHAFATVVVDELVRHGVRHAVTAPGSRSTPLALALAADPRIRLHVRIDERSAAFLALGIARTTGDPVPVVCTSGTATAHFHAAVLEADQARVPLLVLTSDRPPELRGVSANQTVDQVAMYGSAVRWSCDVGIPEARTDSVRYWRSLVSRGVAVSLGASGGAAGPVHLNLPFREPLTPVDDGIGFPGPLDGRAGGAAWTQSRRGITRVPDDIARAIHTARRGVIVAGDGLTGADVRGVVAFSQAARWPLVAEPHSNARCGATALRATDAVLSAPRFLDAHAPDLVVVAGRVGLSRTLLGWLQSVPHVVIDRDGTWADPTRSAAAVVRADAATLPGCEPAATSGWLEDWLDASRAASAAIDAVLDAEQSLTEPLVARDIAAAVADGGCLVVASSMPIRDLDLTMAPREQLRIIANRGVSGIDGFVSTAIGVATAHQGPVVALAGDLSMLHDSNGLIADERPDVTFVVTNNDGGGIFSLLPQAETERPDTFERLFGTPHGVDFGRLAAAYDVGHSVATAASELAQAAGEKVSGLNIVEVRTDRRSNAELHARLRAAAAAALR